PVGGDRVLEVAEQDVRLRGDLRELRRHLRVRRVEEVDAAGRLDGDLAHRLRRAEGERLEEIARAAHPVLVDGRLGALQPTVLRGSGSACTSTDPGARGSPRGGERTTDTTSMPHRKTWWCTLRGRGRRCDEGPWRPSRTASSRRTASAWRCATRVAARPSSSCTASPSSPTRGATRCRPSPPPASASSRRTSACTAAATAPRTSPRTTSIT